MKKKILFFVIAPVILAGFIISCNKNDDNGGTKPTTTAVTISGFKFNSADLHVKAGTTVTWTNNDDAVHTVTADDNSFTSGDLAKGDTYTHTFSSAGTLHYHCKYHSMMKADVVVE